MNVERTITLFLIIFTAAVSRLLPHPDNVAPIAAIALFAGARFERKSLAFALPLLPMLLSDLVLGHPSKLAYLSFALTVCLGFTLRRQAGAARVIGASLAASVLFFLVTNCVFLGSGHMYPKTFEGLLLSYEMGIPFFRGTLLGDLFYSTLLFGGFALAERRFAWLRVRPLATA